MKRCPYCAEEIQDAAIRCRYCDSMLPISGGPGPDLLGKDVEVVESGRRYAVGVVDERYAVWDLLAPGEPLERFTGDSEGLHLALDRYAKLERMARGRFRWLPPVRVAFVFGVVVWAVARGIDTTWYYVLSRSGGGRIPTGLVFVQAVIDIAFVVWVGSLASIAALWLTDTLRARAGGR